MVETCENMTESAGRAVESQDVSNPQMVQNNMPQLRFQDQTPIGPAAKGHSNKRTRAQLSPQEEEMLLQSEDFPESFTIKMQQTIEEVVKQFIPEIVSNLEKKLKESIRAIVREEMDEALLDYENRQSLLTLSQSELLESYNRRDNIRILGLPEDNPAGGRGETYEQTTEKVLGICSKLDTGVDEKDISIAHRLPSNKRGLRPIIVRFSRRMAKINIMRRKRELMNKESTKDVKIFEDLTRPRLAFLNMMKSDTRIQNAWTREGTIYFVWKEDGNIYKVNGLYEGGVFLNYNIEDVLGCFNFRGVPGT